MGSLSLIFSQFCFYEASQLEYIWTQVKVREKKESSSI
jgi:hypothetical protein